jgi:hypothetical protein
MDLEKEFEIETNLSSKEKEEKAAWHNPVFLQLKASNGTKKQVDPGNDGMTTHS